MTERVFQPGVFQKGVFWTLSVVQRTAQVRAEARMASDPRYIKFVQKDQTLWKDPGLRVWDDYGFIPKGHRGGGATRRIAGA